MHTTLTLLSVAARFGSIFHCSCNENQHNKCCTNRHELLQKRIFSSVGLEAGRAQSLVFYVWLDEFNGLKKERFSRSPF